MISIIVPVYDVEEYVADCIESIIAQTYKNIEIILVNDGSRDSSGQICDKYAEKDKRIVVIHKKNGGLSSARNAGINIARGDYFSFIDSDDWVSPKFIEILYRELIKNEADISQCGFKSGNINQKENNSNDQKSTCITGKEAVIKLLDRKTYLKMVVIWNKLYKRSIFEEVRFKEGIIHEDEAIAHELLYKAHKVVLNERKLYYYRSREGSIMKSDFSLKRLDAIYAYEKRILFFKEREEFDFIRRVYPIYFRVLIGLGSELYNSQVSDKHNYIDQIIIKTNNILSEINNNKYMKPLDKLLLFSYKIAPKFAFDLSRLVSKLKNHRTSD